MYFLYGLFICFLISLLCSYFFNYYKLPTFLGLMFAGLILKTLQLPILQTELLGHFGILFLLFIIGMETSISGMYDLKPLIGYCTKMLILLVIMFFFPLSFFLPIKTSILLSCILSLSSTPIVMTTLSKTNNLNTNLGKISFCLLLLQDIVAVGLIIYLQATHSTYSFPLLLTGILVFVPIIYLSILFIDSLLSRILKVSNELLIVFVLSMILAYGLLYDFFGLSMEIGVLMAGLILGESKFKIEIESNVEILKNIFLSFFFIHMGTYFDMAFFWENSFLILGLVILILFLKATYFYLMTRHKLGIKAIVFASLMSNISEFGFLVTNLLFLYGFLNLYLNNLIFSILCLSLVFASFTITIAPHILKKVMGQSNYQEDMSGILLVGINSYSNSLATRLHDLGFTVHFIDLNISKVLIMRNKNLFRVTWSSIYDFKILTKIKNTKLLFFSFIVSLRDLGKLIELKHYLVNSEIILMTKTERERAIFIQHGFIALNSVEILMIPLMEKVLQVLKMPIIMM